MLSIRSSLAFGICLTVATFAVTPDNNFAQENKAQEKNAAQKQKPATKIKVELRWVESEAVAGLTETEGFQTSCDPDDIAYPHKKPALVLTADTVSDVELKTHDFSNNGLGVYYSVTLHLTDKARSQLADSIEGNKMRLITVLVDDKYWGVYRYEKDKDKQFVPRQARASSFTPNVGMFSSYNDAKRVVDAINAVSNEVKD